MNFPHLFLQSFYGRKEYGIWGFRYFSQHEVYWEQTLLFGATLHNDFNDYRINAHGTRLQNLWSMNYRFLPANIGHGLVTRMGEGYYDPSVEKANDLISWKYSLLSAIACCGSGTHCNWPDKLENVPEMPAFYDKWIRWAKENYRFCRYTIPISDNVANGVLDGFARINSDEGQIFLFNSSPLTLRKQQKLPFNFLSSTPNKLSAYIPFAGVEMPEEVQLRINGAEIPVEVFSLRNIPFLHYAFIEKICDLSEIDMIVTDSGIADDILEIYKNHVKIIKA